VKYSIVGEKPSRYRNEPDIFFMVTLAAPLYAVLRVLSFLVTAVLVLTL
jgi:hypothetical protein